jgi:hypothetical protein
VRVFVGFAGTLEFMRLGKKGDSVTAASIQGIMAVDGKKVEIWKLSSM